MPDKQLLEAYVWFYQDFVNETQAKAFWLNRPEDWSRLQILEGDTMKPAMEAGFRGQPTKEQVVRLHECAKSGKLFFFELGNTGPLQLGNTDKSQKYINLNPKEPTPPKPLPPDATDSQKSGYDYSMNVYNHRMAQYRTNLEVLKRLGDDFKNAVMAYNESRDLEWETAEKNGRETGFSLVKEKRNRDKADRVIDGLFGPKPEYVPDMVFDVDHPADEAVFKKTEFEEQIAPNTINLPPDSKLSARDVATINLAMMGAKNIVEKTSQRIANASPLNAVFFGSNGFHMLITGMFGQSRKNQQLSGNKIMGAVLQESKDAIEMYLAGDANRLGRHLGACVRNIKDVFTGSSANSLSQDTVAATKLVERIHDLLRKDAALLQAADLKENELEFMRGYVQMGKAFDNYLSGAIKLNEAQAHGQTLAPEQKAEILADAVIRVLLEKELDKDSQEITNSEEYLNNYQEAIEKDQPEAALFDKWKTEVLAKITDPYEQMRAEEKYKREHDVNMHVAQAFSVPTEHKIFSMLAKNGMLERLRQNLQNDPNILAAAAKEPLELNVKDLANSPAIKALADQAAPTLQSLEISGQEKLQWFESMKAMVSGQDSPWINANVAGDADRLMIAVANAQGGKDLVSVASLLKGGLNALENPDQQAIDLMYRNAMEGNLYYYNVGMDMPQRLMANGAEAAVEQIKPPVQPTAWQRFANFITGGWAYADIVNPPADRDPAAKQCILTSRDGRTAILTIEMNAHEQARQEEHQQANRNRKTAEDRIREDVNSFRRIPDDSVRREFPQYDLDSVVERVNRMALVDTQSVQDNALAGEMSRTAMYMKDRLCAENPTQHQMREVMAAAVLLEAVKAERLSGEDTIYTQLMRSRNGMVQSMVQNDVFQAFTKDISMDMVKHFVMSDGARNMFQAMKDIALNRSNQQQMGKEPNALENNMQAQNVPKNPMMN